MSLRTAGFEELPYPGSEAALQYLQQRDAYCTSAPMQEEMPVDSGRRSRHRPTMMTSTSHYVTPSSGARHSSHKVPTTIMRSYGNVNGGRPEDETNASASASQALPPWLSVTTQVCRTLDNVCAKVEGSTQQLELERSIRQSAMRETKMSTTNQFAELWAVVRQLQEENKFLKRSVRDLEGRQAWGDGGGGLFSLQKSSPVAGASSSMSGTAAAAAESDSSRHVHHHRLQELEETIQRQQDRWEEKANRLKNTMQEEVHTAVEVELQRMRSLARETAKEVAAEQIRRAVEAEKTDREDSMRRMEDRLGHRLQQYQSSSDTQVRQLQLELTARVDLVKSAVDTVTTRLAAAPTPESILAEVDSRWRALRLVLDQQKSAADREHAAEREEWTIAAKEREAGLRHDVQKMLRDSLQEVTLRAVSQSEVSSMIEAAVNTLRGHVTVLQDGQQDLKTRLTTQQQSLEDADGKLLALQRRCDQQQADGQSLKEQSREVRGSLLLQKDELTRCSTTLFDTTCPRLEQAVERLDQIARSQAEEHRVVEMDRTKTEKQWREARATSDRLTEELRQVHARLDALATTDLQCGAKLEKTEAMLSTCLPLVHTMEKKLSGVQTQMETFTARLEAQLGVEIPGREAVLRQEVEQYRRDVKQQLQAQLDEVRTSMEKAQEDQVRQLKQVQDAMWRRCEEEMAPLRASGLSSAAQQQEREKALAEQVEAVAAEAKRLDVVWRAAQENWETDKQALQASIRTCVQTQEGEADTRSDPSPQQQQALATLTQQRLHALREEMAELEGRVAMEREEAIQRLQRRVDENVKRSLRLYEEMTKEEIQALVDGSLSDHTMDIRSRVEKQVLELVSREIYGSSANPSAAPSPFTALEASGAETRTAAASASAFTSAPRRLVGRMMADDVCRRDLMDGLRADLEALLLDNRGNHQAGRPSAVPSDGVTSVLIDHFEHRLRAVEEWHADERVGVLEEAHTVLQRNASALQQAVDAIRTACDHCQEENEATEQRLSELEKANEEKLKGEEPQQTTVLQRQVSETDQRVHAMQSQIDELRDTLSQPSADVELETRVAAVEARCEAAAQSHATAVHVLSEERGRLAGLRDEMRVELDLLVKPVSMQIQDLLGRQHKAEEQQKAVMQKHEEALRQELDQIATRLTAAEQAVEHTSAELSDVIATTVRQEMEDRKTQQRTDVDALQTLVSEHRLAQEAALEQAVANLNSRIEPLAEAVKALTASPQQEQATVRVESHEVLSEEQAEQREDRETSEEGAPHPACAESLETHLAEAKTAILLTLEERLVMEKSDRLAGQQELVKLLKSLMETESSEIQAALEDRLEQYREEEITRHASELEAQLAETRSIQATLTAMEKELREELEERMTKPREVPSEWASHCLEVARQAWQEDVDTLHRQLTDELHAALDQGRQEATALLHAHVEDLHSGAPPETDQNSPPVTPATHTNALHASTVETPSPSSSQEERPPQQARELLLEVVDRLEALEKKFNKDGDATELIHQRLQQYQEETHTKWESQQHQVEAVRMQVSEAEGLLVMMQNKVKEVEKEIGAMAIPDIVGVEERIHDLAEQFTMLNESHEAALVVLKALQEQEAQGVGEAQAHRSLEEDSAKGGGIPSAPAGSEPAEDKKDDDDEEQVVCVQSLAARVEQLEEALLQLRESEEEGLMATTDALGDLQESLAQCVLLVQEEVNASDPWCVTTHLIPSSSSAPHPYGSSSPHLPHPSDLVAPRQAGESIDGGDVDTNVDREEHLPQLPPQETTAITVASMNNFCKQVNSLEDVFLYLVRLGFKTQNDIGTIQESLLSILDLVQQHEIDVTGGVYADANSPEEDG